MRSLAIVAVFVGACGGATYQTVQLVNHTDRTIKEVYIFPVGSAQQGASRGTIAPNATLAVKVKAGNVDVLAVSEKVRVDATSSETRTATQTLELEAPTELVFYDSNQKPPVDRPGSIGVSFRIIPPAEPPVREWLAMVREHETFDLDALKAPIIDEVRIDRVRRDYAQSLAMLIYLTEKSGDTGLREAVHVMQATAGSRHGALGIWDKLAPGVTATAVLDALARKIFNLAPSAELDGIFAGAVCCRGLKSVRELACRGAPSHPGETFWIDRTVTPRLVCNTRW